MNIAGFKHAVRALDPGEALPDAGLVFVLSNGQHIVGYCDPENVGAELGIVLIMNDTDSPAVPQNVMVDVASIVAIRLTVEGE